MGKLNVLTHSFAFGEVSRAGLNRVDKEVIRLYAERQENLLPRTIGKAIQRAGTQFLGSGPIEAPSRYLEFIKSIDDTALLEMSAAQLRIWIDDELLTREAVTSTIADGDFASSAGWTLVTTSGGSAAIAGGVLTLAVPARGSIAYAQQEVTTSNVSEEHAVRVRVTQGPVILRIGASDGGDEYLSESELDTGEHSLAFTPTGIVSGTDSFTKLLLHCEGVDGSQTFTDSSPSAHSVTFNGNVQIDTAQAKFGTASGLFLTAAATDYLSLDGSSDFAFGTGDFTVDMQVHRSASGANQFLFDSRPFGTTVGLYPTLFISTGSKLVYFTNGSTRITGTTTLATGVWYHVALVRASGVTRIYVNGVSEGGTFVDATSYIVGASRPAIGAAGSDTSGGLDGWLDEIRVSTGVARWTTSFAPPSSAYGGSGNSYFVRLLTRRETPVIVDSIEVEGAGIVSLSAPWGVSQLTEFRSDQSQDVIFLTHTAWQSRKIERRNNARSWAVALYAPEDGPFTVGRTLGVKLKPAATHGATTLTADANFFRPDHVGALFRLEHDRFAATFDLAAEETFTDAYRLHGIGTENDHSVVVTGTWVGTITMQMSFDGEFGPFIDLATPTPITANGTMTLTTAVALDNQILHIRVGFKAGAYTSGTATIAPTYGGHGGAGIGRVTSYTSPTVVNIDVLDDFKNTFYTDIWTEGEWSTLRGFPSAIGFFDFRLWLARKDKFWGSVVDNYYGFTLDIEGDSGSIQRNIATGGPSHKSRWILGLQRLLFGTDAGEASARSSSFDEPLTPTQITIKPAAANGVADASPTRFGSRGYYICRDTQRIFEIAFSVEAQDYVARDVTRLNEDLYESANPDLFADGFVQVAGQNTPDPYLWARRTDGAACVLLCNPGEEARAWFKVTTGCVNALALTRPWDRIVDIAVLPATGEDRVYLQVERVISDGAGGTQALYYLEKLMPHSAAVTRVRNATTGAIEAKNGLKMADSFILTAGTGAIGQVVTGLTHLAGRQVIIVGQAVGGIYGPSEDLYTVSAAGTITTLQAFSGSICVGLPYAGYYKSAKLAYAAQGGTALTIPKRVESVGLAQLDTHPDALRFGDEFAADIFDMDEMPRVNSKMEVVDPTANFQRANDESPFPFPGKWDTDSRVCIYVRPGYSATLSGLVTSIDTAG